MEREKTEIEVVNRLPSELQKGLEDSYRAVEAVRRNFARMHAVEQHGSKVNVARKIPVRDIIRKRILSVGNTMTITLDDGVRVDMSMGLELGLVRTARRNHLTPAVNERDIFARFPFLKTVPLSMIERSKLFAQDVESASIGNAFRIPQFTLNYPGAKPTGVSFHDGQTNESFWIRTPRATFSFCMIHPLEGNRGLHLGECRAQVSQNCGKTFVVYEGYGNRVAAMNVNVAHWFGGDLESIDPATGELNVINGLTRPRTEVATHAHRAMAENEFVRKGITADRVSVGELLAELEAIQLHMHHSGQALTAARNMCGITYDDAAVARGYNHFVAAPRPLLKLL